MALHIINYHQNSTVTWFLCTTACLFVPKVCSIRQSWWLSQLWYVILLESWCLIMSQLLISNWHYTYMNSSWVYRYEYRVVKWNLFACNFQFQSSVTYIRTYIFWKIRYSKYIYRNTIKIHSRRNGITCSYSLIHIMHFSEQYA